MSQFAQAADAGEGRVFVSRHPAERLSGCRVVLRDEDGAVAVMPTPSQVPTTIGHFGMLADVVCAQSVVVGLSPQRSVRTIGLAVHMMRPVRPGTMLEAHAQRRLLDDGTGVSTAEISVEGGQLVAVTVARFLVLHEAHDHAVLDHVENAEVLQPSPTWDAAFGIEPTGPATLTATPTAEVGNTVGSMHGGMQTRMFDLAAQHWLAGQNLGQAQLSDLSVTYHRGAPADGTNPVHLRVEETRRGRRLCELALYAEDAAGKLISAADATILL